MKNYLKSIQKNHPISSAYIMLLIVSIAAFYLRSAIFPYGIPIYLMTAPFLYGQKITIKANAKDTIIGIAISAIALLPFSTVMILAGKQFTMPSFETLLFQIAAVAFPEELFFRGFVQEQIGNNKKGIVITSLLFAGAHLPISTVSGSLLPLLSFFPSLAMGWLYMRASNILPCVIFHFLANMAFIGFGGF